MLFIFARFHAYEGCEAELAQTLVAVVRASREEPGCRSIHAFRSKQSTGLYFIHSSWVDEAAFDRHAALAHTVEFIERAQKLIDHPLDVTRATLVE
jgi:quinol monooxygenase YgiN